METEDLPDEKAYGCLIHERFLGAKALTPGDGIEKGEINETMDQDEKEIPNTTTYALILQNIVLPLGKMCNDEIMGMMA